MATKKQIAANRRNALKSTGPRTESGKAVSRLNALRHGLRAKAAIVSAESLHELSQIRALFLHSFPPETPEQARLVERMACARWHLLNWQRVETQFLAESADLDPLRQARTLDRLNQRQGRYQRAFMTAYREHQRATGATPLPESRPAA